MIWAIKQSNEYFDSQLIDVYETLTESANVVLYKSNTNTIQNDDWRYTKAERYQRMGKYCLDYRIVLHRVGGYVQSTWKHETGISGNAANLVSDLMVVAQHAGFDVQYEDVKARQWEAGKVQAFYFKNAQGQIQTLLEVKAFMNGNLHIKPNQLFIQKLNIMHGKLKGWIRTAEDVSTEMDIPVDVAESLLQNTDIRISLNNLFLILH